MSRKTGGLGTVPIRTREDAREDAGRIQAGANTPPATAEPVDTATDSAVSESSANGHEFDPDTEPAAQDTPPAAPARSRKRKSLPTSLTPSRVSQRRIQIGPRLRPSIHTDFTDYCLALSTMGFTQSDLVESALVEYMDRYPAEAVRAALLEDK